MLSQPTLPGLVEINEEEQDSQIKQILEDYTLSFSSVLSGPRRLALAVIILEEYGSPSFLSATQLVEMHSAQIQN